VLAFLQPADEVFFNFYGQPLNCRREECDFFVEWKNNGEYFIDFQIEGNADGWIALGITGQDSPLNTVSKIHTHNT